MAIWRRRCFAGGEIRAGVSPESEGDAAGRGIWNGWDVKLACGRDVRQPDASRGHAANFWYEVRMNDRS